MSTAIQNLNQSPPKGSFRQSQLPFQSIIRQVATPSGYQQVQKGAKINVITHQPSTFTYQNTQRLVENHAQFVGGANVKTNNVTKTVHLADMPTMAPIRRIQYVPYEQKYIEYVEQRVTVPVQRMCTDYYKVEHIIDYVPIEKEDTVYEVQPKEVVTMKLQYVPVEQKIVHISDKNAKTLGIKQYISTDLQNPILATNPLYQQVHVSNEVLLQRNQNVNFASNIRRSRTNFVTSEGYDPQASLRQIDNILASSRLRASRATIQP